MSFFPQGTSVYNVSTLEGKECLKEDILLLMRREGMFIILTAPFLSHTYYNQQLSLKHYALIMPRSYWNDIITKICFDNILNLGQFFSDLKSVKIQVLLQRHELFYSKISALFFPKQESLDSQLPITPVHLLL